MGVPHHTLAPLRDSSQHVRVQLRKNRFLQLVHSVCSHIIGASNSMTCEAVNNCRLRSMSNFVGLGD